MVAAGKGPDGVAEGLEAARRRLSAAVRRDPADAAALHALGMTLAAMGGEASALGPLRQAVRVAPSRAASWRALGDLHLLAGEAEPAGRMYAAAVWAGARDPAVKAAAWALREGDWAEAAAAMQRHLRGGGGRSAEAAHLLAEAAMRLGQAAAAEAMLRQGLAAAAHAGAGHAAARHSLAVLLLLQERWGEAIPLLRAALADDPADSNLAKLLANAWARIGDHASALPIYAALLAGHDAQPRLWLLYAHACKAVGRAAAAEAAYRRVIAMLPRSGSAWLSLAELKTAAFAPADLVAMRAAIAAAPADTDECARLHYALGRALEQRQDAAGAFAAYAQGARLRRSLIRYDAAATGARVDALCGLFTPAFFAAREAGGCCDEAPIFIVGLARSGSTLVEQILASHSQVEATMELAEIGRIAVEVAEVAGGLGGLDGAARRRLGERYLHRTRQFRRLGRRRFIDKMPDNFFHIGLIRLILPDARIIDVRRAPMAAGFAVFKQFFQPEQTGQDYSYDLREIGAYLRDSETLMRHWALVLPTLVHRLRYEDLVADTEAQVRALLAYCGLDFEPACLRFWETARAVQTPSAQQVRQPISAAGVEAWRPYAEWLGELQQHDRM